MPISPLLMARLIRRGNAAARRAGLPRYDWDDCAAAFALRMLDEKRRAFLVRLPDDARRDVYLRRCAQRFASNFARQTRRCAFHEQPWPDTPNDVENAARRRASVNGNAPAPEVTPVHHELQQRLRAALARLEPGARDLLVRHYLRDETAVAIAAVLNETPNVIGQRLHRARRQLRRVLERQGFDEIEAREYLAILGSAPPPY